MKRKEQTYEVKINGIPNFKEIPQDLKDLFFSALLEVITENTKQAGECLTEFVETDRDL